METMATKKRGVHYGYVIVISMIFYMALMCGLTCNLNGLFFTPVMEEFGCSRADASFYLTIFFITAAVSQPIAGWTISKFNNRWLFGIIDLIYCLGYIWTAYAKSVMVFNIFGIIYGFTAAHFMYLGGPVMINRWFKKGSATAYGVVQVAINVLQLFASPIIQGMITNNGWRSARLAGGLFCLILCVPFTFLLVRHDPSKKGLKAIGEDAPDAVQEKEQISAPANVEGVSFSTALKNPAFYLNCLLVASLATAATVMQFISSYGASSSIGATTAAFGLSILSGAAIGYKFLWSLLSDLMGSVKVLMIASFGGAAGLVLMMLSGAGEVPKVGLFYLSCAMFSMSYSCLGVLAPAFTKSAWGRRDYARIYSICTSCLFVMNAIGNYIYAALSDAGGFTGVFIFAIVLYAVIFVLAPVVTRLAKKSWAA